MKHLVILALITFANINCYSEAPAVPMQAQLLRATTGRTLNEKGLASGTMVLKPGMIFDVADQKMTFVVLLANGQKVVVNQNEVKMSPKTEAASVPAESGFTAGQVILISARYTIEGSAPRNVKNRLAKLIPQGILTEPVNIMVTDALSSAAMSQDSVIRGTITPTGNNSAAITLQETAKNILTVEYSFNGQTRKKQVLEGSYLTLP